MLAADMGTGQSKMMAQTIRQREPRLNVHVDLSTVDAKSYRHGRSPIALLRHDPLTRPRV
jgi:hypothetical protein